MTTRTNRCFHIFIAIMPALIFAAARILKFFPSLLDAPICAFRSITDIPCPGCGLTHSIVELAHGNLLASIFIHPMGIVISVWLIYISARFWTRSILSRELPQLLDRRGKDRVILLVIAVSLVWWTISLLQLSGGAI